MQMKDIPFNEAPELQIPFGRDQELLTDRFSCGSARHVNFWETGLVSVVPAQRAPISTSVPSDRFATQA